VNPAVAATVARKARRHRGALIALGLFSPCACGTLLTVGMSGGGVAWMASEANAQPCQSMTLPGQQVGEWTPEQTGNAGAIVAEGQRRGLPSRAFVVAVAVAMQESHLLNLDHGDRDSLGLFQQRPSQGWGTPAQVMDPAYAAGQFYARLVLVTGWEQMPLWQAAQTVQRSGFPMAYAKWEQAATDLVAHLGVVPSTGGGCVGAVNGGYANPLPPDKIVPPLGPHHDYPAADIPVPVGTPVYAVVGGRVAYIDGGYGLGVQITAENGVTWVYGHNSAYTVNPGVVVNTGDLIAYSGNTGQSTGPHLHIDITVVGVKRCPQPLLDAVVSGLPVPDVGSLPVTGCFY
jgi:murein DD-endopeptidase MepM/ murein hydrolase activator NlpD